MLRFQNFLIIVWAAVAFSVSTVSVVAQSQLGTTIRLATQELPPYHMILLDKDSNKPEIVGLAVDQVICALNELNRNYEITLTDFPSAQLGTQTGVYDGFFVASANSARAKYSKPSAPIIFNNLAWYMPLKSKIDPNDPADALVARYSAKFSTSKWLYLMKNGYNVVMRPQNAASLLNMLLVGEIDVALEYDLIFEYYMKERGIPNSQFIKTPFKSKTMHAHFSNEFLNANPSFLSQFDASVVSCAADLR